MSALDAWLPKVHGHPISRGLAGNVAAGVTVALINLPLSISLAVASGATPLMGVITGTWGSFIGSLCGGSHFNIMGPTGALSGILFRYAVMYGAEVLPVLSLLSGVICFIIFALNWDQYVMFLPSGVNVGFCLGVAFIIAAGQLSSACGLTGLAVHHDFLSNLREAVSHLPNADLPSFALFFVSWLALFSLARKWRKLPWGVPLAVIGMIIGYLSESGSIHKFVTLRSKYGSMSEPLFQPPSWKPAYTAGFSDLLYASLSVSFVAVLETLISGKIADGLTKTNMNPRRETFAVSMANLVSGVSGGLPATAALARTALNIRAGASSRVAGMLNAVFSFVIAWCLLSVFSYLPLPIIAALLFQVAIGMIESRHLVRFFRLDPAMLFLALCVAVLCVVLEPTTGIVFGLVVGLLQNAQKIAAGYSVIMSTRHRSQRIDFDAVDEMQHPIPHAASKWDRWMHSVRDCFADPDVEDAQQRRTSQLSLSDHYIPQIEMLREREVLVYRIVGYLTYINALKHFNRLQRLLRSRHAAQRKAIILSFRYAFYVDIDGLEVVEEIGNLFQQQGVIVLLAALPPTFIPLASRSDWFKKQQAEGHVFCSYQSATQWLAERGLISHPASPKVCRVVSSTHSHFPSALPHSHTNADPFCTETHAFRPRIDSLASVEEDGTRPILTQEAKEQMAQLYLASESYQNADDNADDAV